MQWSKASFYQQQGQAILCLLCPHACVFTTDKEVGFCHVRRRHGQCLETATFAVAVQYLDAIERKPLYHYKPGAQVLTLAAPGCQFRCLYCQNYRLSQFGRHPEIGWQAKPVVVQSIIATALNQQALLGLSYSEPSLAAELTLALAQADQGVELIWKTNGFFTAKARQQLVPYLAAINLDLKTVNQQRHHALTGAPVKPILENLGAFYNAGIWLEVSTPIIPKINADTDSLWQLAETIYAVSPDIPWHLLRFTPEFKLRHLPPTSPALLNQAVQIAHQVGLKYVYVERALGESGRNTFCPQCHRELISRRIWGIQHNRLNQGHCPDCGIKIPGSW
jgi:pyruvate formate lyase activating enzyme